MNRSKQIAKRGIKSDGQEKSTKILISLVQVRNASCMVSVVEDPRQIGWYLVLAVLLA